MKIPIYRVETHVRQFRPVARRDAILTPFVSEIVGNFPDGFLLSKGFNGAPAVAVNQARCSPPSAGALATGLSFTDGITVSACCELTHAALPEIEPSPLSAWKAPEKPRGRQAGRTMSTTASRAHHDCRGVSMTVLRELLLVVLGLSLLIVGLAVYFAPALTAQARRHRERGAIAVLNLFLGWTVLGWVGALVWSFTSHVETDSAEVAERELDEWNRRHPPLPSLESYVPETSEGVAARSLVPTPKSQNPKPPPITSRCDDAATETNSP